MSAPIGRRGFDRAGRVTEWLALPSALLILNSALTFQNVWPTFGVRWVPEFSIELTALLWVLVLVAAAGKWPGRAMRRFLIGGYLLFIVGRYLDVTAPALMGRSIDLYWDSQYAFHVVLMFVSGIPLWRLLILATVLLVACTGLIIVLRWSFGVLLGALVHPPSRWRLGVLSLTLLTLYGAGRLSLSIPTERWFALPVSNLFVSQVQLVLKTTVLRDDHWLASQPPLPPSNFHRLHGGDLSIWFFESYGALVFDDPRFAIPLATAFAALEQELASAGWRSVSARVTSSTFGGSSWLAHSSLLSGLRIADQTAYQALLASRRATLVTRLAEAGYRTVALMPGLKFPWPEGQFYGFAQIYNNQALHYTGPAYGWWAIPDQYSVYRTHQLEAVHSQRAPLFVFFPTINSHAPFTPLPAYQTDWNQFDASTLLPATESTDISSRLDGEALATAYQNSVRYNLAVLGGYMRHYAPANALVMVLGDHQPPAVVGGREISWQTPVHLFSRDTALLQTFINLGFQAGMTPAKHALGGVESLTPLLLQSLNSEPDANQQPILPVSTAQTH